MTWLACLLAGAVAIVGLVHWRPDAEELTRLDVLRRIVGRRVDG